MVLCSAFQRNPGELKNKNVNLILLNKSLITHFISQIPDT